jgi:catechol 2,3-dioxygenase-like lactoylglutathione lyase family enzyme
MSIEPGRRATTRGIIRMRGIRRGCIAFLLAGVGAHASWALSRELAGIAHVALRVNDLAQTRAFYEKLGFEQAFEFTEAGKTTESFIKINDRQFIELYPRTADSQALGLTHLCFEATDIQSVRAAYSKQELNPPEAKKGRAGNLLFTIHDPEGQLIEYTQYMPESLHSADRGKHLGARVSQHLVEAVLVAQDPSAERAFYIDKLGFDDGLPSGMGVRIPGNSGDRVAFQLAGAMTKPRLVFTVEDVRRAARELLHRRLSVTKDQDGIAVSDPDGMLVVFTAQRNPAGPQP